MLCGNEWRWWGWWRGWSGAVRCGAVLCNDPAGYKALEFPRNLFLHQAIGFYIHSIVRSFHSTLFSVRKSRLVPVHSFIHSVYYLPSQPIHSNPKGTQSKARL